MREFWRILVAVGKKAHGAHLGGQCMVAGGEDGALSESEMWVLHRCNICRRRRDELWDK